jgi:hypothetical protein
VAAVAKVNLIGLSLIVMEDEDLCGGPTGTEVTTHYWLGGNIEVGLR